MNFLSRFLIATVLSALVAPAQTPAHLADRARDLARAGAFEPALDLYSRALAVAPDDVAIRLDYAVTLGWAERYQDARQQFREVLRRKPDQPAWALREMARCELFGDNPAGALALLDRLIAQGDTSEQTVLRKGLALRWLARPDEAEQVYRAQLKRQPASIEGRVGLAYSLADRDRLEQALAVLEQTPQPDWRLTKAKAQILNWMGRHRAARPIFDSLLAEHQGDPEVLEGRTLAARWGGDPATARGDGRTLYRSFPARASAARLNRDVALEYGFSATTSARWIEDSDGLLDQTYGQEFAWHPAPAHQFRFGGQYRRFAQDDALAWRRWEAGWNGALASRMALAGSVASVDYLSGARDRRWVGDGSMSFWLGDQARIFAGAGRLAMDSYRSVEERVTASFYSTGLAWRPRRLLSLEGQFSQYRFSDGVRRDRVDLAGFHRVWLRRRARLEVGGRSNWMWHDRETPHFFSPRFFQSHIGVLRASGRLSSRIEYRTEIGAGVQREPWVPTESPLVVSGQVTVRLSSGMRLDAEAGRSTSSLERVNSGRSSYARRFASISLIIRWD